MITLLDLLNELLLEILIACPDVQTAAFLSAANRSLRNFWLANNHQIATRILRLAVDDFDDALELAVREIQNSAPPQAEVKSSPAISILVLKILNNASLAASATAEYRAFVAKGPANNYRHSLQLTSLTKAYYLARQVVLSEVVRNRADKAASRTVLDNVPEKNVILALEVAHFLSNCASDEERERQGVAKDKADWTPDDEMVVNPSKDEWEETFMMLARVAVEFQEQNRTKQRAT